jgi:hypothetical protein
MELNQTLKGVNGIATENGTEMEKRLPGLYW